MLVALYSTIRGPTVALGAEPLEHEPETVAVHRDLTQRRPSWKVARAARASCIWRENAAPTVAGQLGALPPILS